MKRGYLWRQSSLRIFLWLCFQPCRSIQYRGKLMDQKFRSYIQWTDQRSFSTKDTWSRVYVWWDNWTFNPVSQIQIPEQHTMGHASWIMIGNWALTDLLCLNKINIYRDEIQCWKQKNNSTPRENSKASKSGACIQITQTHWWEFQASSKC